jgi:hypothetical protein
MCSNEKLPSTTMLLLYNQLHDTSNEFVNGMSKTCVNTLVDLASFGGYLFLVVDMQDKTVQDLLVKNLLVGHVLFQIASGD